MNEHVSSRTNVIPFSPVRKTTLQSKIVASDYISWTLKVESENNIVAHPYFEQHFFVAFFELKLLIQKFVDQNKVVTNIAQ